MPNHITNIMIFTDELKDKIANTDGIVDFRIVVPTPEDDIWYNTHCYDWNYANWGTKWNAYNSDVFENKAYFDTAWCCPLTWYAQLAKLGDFKVIYADEDTGYNLGIIEAKDGELYIQSDADFTMPERYALAWFITSDREYCMNLYKENGDDMPDDVQEAYDNYDKLIEKILPEGF